MNLSLKNYKEKFHFSVNFYSLFLLFTFIPDILQIEASPFKLIFWGIKLLLAGWLIFRTRKTFFNFGTFENMYLLVFFIYGANIYRDVFLDPKPILNYSRGLMDFLGFCITLILALSFRYDKLYYSEKSFNFFWISLTIGLVVAYFMAVENSEIGFDANNVRFDANSTVNTINYGQMGCALALISIFGLTAREKLFDRILFIITFLIGMVSIAKAGSRSPILVLIIVCVFYSIARLGALKGILLMLIFVALFAFFFQSILMLLDSMGSTLAVRIENAITEDDSSGRDAIWRNTLDLIGQEPYFGNYYFLPSGIGAGGYPHNFFLEAFLTTGIFGGIPFVILVIIGLAKSYKLIQQRHPASWIVVLYLQMVVFGNISSSLYSSQDFWVLLFFILSARFVSEQLPAKTETIENPKKILVI